jgi:hypothetical protein
MTSPVYQGLALLDASSSETLSSYAAKVSARADHATGDISPVWNAVAFRRSFPDRWAEYLRETYRTAYAVEKAFGIDSKTSRDWISGKRDPSGSFVAAVCARDPRAIEILGRAA